MTTACCAFQSIEGADGDLEKILDKKLAKLQERNNSEDLKKHEKYLELLQKVDDLSSQGRFDSLVPDLPGVTCSKRQAC